MESFDVVVIGGGPVGEEASARLADHGMNVALVEERLVGGECAYFACLPSKGLLRPWEALAEARRVPGAREAVTGAVDPQAVLRWRDEIVHDLTDGWAVEFLDAHGVSQQVETSLRAHGVEVRVRQMATRVEPQDGQVTVTTSDGTSVTGDVLLFALGRATHRDLDVETVGLTPGEPIQVDETMQVPSVPWLYAVGDVNGRSMLTHMGRYHARLAADAILGRPHPISPTIDYAGAPHVIFTEPQVASVGYTSEDAHRARILVDVYDTNTGGNDGGRYYGAGVPGTTRFFVDRERRVLVGCTITGAEIVDFLQAATVAVAAEIPLEQLRHAVPPFPTRSELWLDLFQQAGV